MLTGISTNLKAHLDACYCICGSHDRAGGGSPRSIHPIWTLEGGSSSKDTTVSELLGHFRGAPLSFRRAPRSADTTRWTSLTASPTINPLDVQVFTPQAGARCLRPFSCLGFRTCQSRVWTNHEFVCGPQRSRIRC